MADFLTALALVLVIEGLFLAVAPLRVKQILALMETVPPESLRVGGLAAAALGVFCVWLLRG